MERYGEVAGMGEVNTLFRRRKLLCSFRNENNNNKQCIDYGTDDAFKIVSDLIIDDGVPNRGHRHALFTPEFKLVGIACGAHPKIRSMCVLNFAVSYEENLYNIARRKDSRYSAV